MYRRAGSGDSYGGRSCKSSWYRDLGKNFGTSLSLYSYPCLQFRPGPRSWNQRFSLSSCSSYSDNHLDITNCLRIFSIRNWVNPPLSLQTLSLSSEFVLIFWVYCWVWHKLTECFIPSISCDLPRIFIELSINPSLSIALLVLPLSRITSLHCHFKSSSSSLLCPASYFFSKKWFPSSSMHLLLPQSTNHSSI